MRTRPWFVVTFAILFNGSPAGLDARADELSSLRAIAEQQKSCASVNAELGSLKGYAKPSGWSLRGSAYYDTQHKAYQEKLTAIQTQPWFSSLEQTLGTPGANGLLEACVKGRLNLKTLCQFLGANYPGCDAVAKIQKEKSWLEGGEQAAQNRLETLSLTEEAVQGKLREVRKESVYTLKLKTYKSEFTADIGKHISNSLEAQYNTVVVSESEYENRHVGEVLSSQLDVMGLFKTDGEISHRKVSVDSKDEVSTFFLVDSAGKTRTLDEEAYDALLNELKKRGVPAQTSSSSGVHSLVLLGKPKNQIRIEKSAPSTHYFVRLRVKNSTFTTNLATHLENTLTANELEIEVPKEVYDSNTSIFDSNFNGMALLTRGSFNTLKGKILSRRQEKDPDNLDVTLDDGRKLTIPKADLAEYRQSNSEGTGNPGTTPVDGSAFSAE